MPKTAREAVAKPQAARRTRQDLAVVIRDKPPTYNWGWFSREDQRMHLQVGDKDHLRLHHKVWLEEKGRRVIQPEPGIPPKAWKILQAEIIKQRGKIEAYWIAFMIINNWLQVQLKGDLITFIAYPDTPNRFQRVLHLSELIPNKEVAKKVTPADVVLSAEYAMLEIFPKREEGARIHEPLDDVLWTN